MVRRWGRKTTFRSAAILLGLAGGVALISTQPAQAQGLFDVLNRIFGGWIGQPSEPPNNASGGPFAYCVRLCDGRYFPMPTNAGAANYSPDKICSAMCPATATKIYTGSGIDQASAADGTSYSKLANAFVYRERMVPDCTCSKEVPGTAAIDIRSDPTLRPGDIVVTRDGLKVFKGSNQLPYQTGDFVPAEDYKGLPAGVRRTLAEFRVTPPEQRVATGPNQVVEDVATVPAPVPEPRAKPVAEFYFPIF